MKKLAVLTACLFFGFPAMAERFGGGSRRGNGGGISHSGGFGGNSDNHRRVPVRSAGRGVFPAYPSRPAGPAFHGAPHVTPRFQVRPDALGNRVTPDHLNRVDIARGRADDLMRRDPHVTDVVRVGRQRYTNFYRPEFNHRTVIIDNDVHHYDNIIIDHPAWVGVWHRHYFFGGLYWGFHPIVDIDDYFYNPMVYWFYVGTFDNYYYSHWYDGDYDAYPQLHQPFAYHGVFYPTENLKQLLFGVSAMTIDKQVRFREAITDFTRALAQNMANGLETHVTLSTGDVVVTHYEVIGYDDAVVLEGLVTFNGTSYNFKGLVDLENPGASDVFVPATWDKNPSSEQLSRLDALNSKISAIRGTPESPENVNAEPDNAMAAPSPGTVSAEPEHK